MAGGGQQGNSTGRTPKGELTRLRESGRRRDDAAKRRIEGAALKAAGELGYRRFSVQSVLDRCGDHRVQFYRHFASKTESFASAYMVELEGWWERVEARAGEGEDWRESLRASLDEVAAIIAEHPAKAIAMLVEVHVAGGAALDRRSEAFERLVGILDGAGRENQSRHSSPPKRTAAFMVGAIESAVIRCLLRGQAKSFADTAPELTRIVIAVYEGEEAGRRVSSGAA